MGLKNYSWPIYKGPVKRPGFAKRLYEDPFSIKRHAKTAKPKHAGNDYAYQLHMKHHPITPKHAKPDYRYARDGRIRKVIPKQEEKQKHVSLSFKERTIPKGPKETPPPRSMLLHLWNDRYDDSFSLEEHRAKRKPLTWMERFRMFNYFREVCMVEGVLMVIGMILVIQESTLFQTIGTSMMIALLVLFPISLISACFHHRHKDRK